MSSQARSNTPVIRREYAPAPDACARDLELLLRKPWVILVVAGEGEL